MTTPATTTAPTPTRSRSKTARPVAQPTITADTAPSLKATVLQENLMLMRDALDKHYADAGKYPTSLEELVAKRYLRAIPKDPFTQSATTWTPVPPSDPKRGGIFDVHSSAKGYERW